MTREDFEFLRQIILGGITNKRERARVSAITYEQALMNERDGRPAFGFDPSISKQDQKALQEIVPDQKPGTVH